MDASNFQTVQFVILGNTYDQLIEWKEIIKKEARKNPGLTSVEDDFDLNKPQLNVKIDQKKAADIGVSTEDIGKTIETIFGSRRVTNFTKDGKVYSICLLYISPSPRDSTLSRMPSSA